jgi:hypothetical protein
MEVPWMVRMTALEAFLYLLKVFKIFLLSLYFVPLSSLLRPMSARPKHSYVEKIFTRLLVPKFLHGKAAILQIGA